MQQLDDGLHCSHRNILRMITVRDFDALAPHVPAWDHLAKEAPQQLPTLLPAWIDAFLRHRLKPDQRWFCSFAYAEDKLLGVLPVIVTPHRLLGHRWPQLRTPFDEHTPSGDVVLAPEHAKAAFGALLTEVMREVPGHLSLDITAVRQNSPVLDVLQDEPTGYLLRRGLCAQYSFLDVQSNPDCYFAGLGKMRRNLRLGRRCLEKYGAVSVEMRSGAGASEEFLTEFLELEASGWKGQMGTAILKNHDLVTFYTSLVRNFAAQEGLEWHSIRVDGRLVAAQLAVRCGASLMLPKYAYDEDFADCMPGHVLIEEVIKDAFSRRELAELNPMSDSMQHRLFHMPRDHYVDLHLVRLNTMAILFQLPLVTTRVLYRDFVQPRITPTMRRAYRKLCGK